MAKKAPPGTGNESKNVADLFPPEDFDGWAESYDRAVRDEGHFPFVGYQAALDKVLTLADVQPGMRVLDLGTGTGNLAVPFAELGCQLWCTDFSSAMLEKARKKLPQVRYILADLRGVWPQELNSRFDRIVSGYVFHHFELEKKIKIIKQLVEDHLEPGGCLIIADISFQDHAAQDAAKEMLGEEWEDEFYWIVAETLPALEVIGLTGEFHAISYCAGVFLIR
jgi:putative AdoMet-dependent methyltransferase